MDRDLEALSYEILSWEENAALGGFGEAFCFVGGRTAALASEHGIDPAPIEKLCRTVARELPSLTVPSRTVPTKITRSTGGFGEGLSF